MRYTRSWLIWPAFFSLEQAIDKATTEADPVYDPAADDGLKELAAAIRDSPTE